MKVRAKERGVYQTLREAGDVFEVGDGETASWFEPIEQSLEGQQDPPDNDPFDIRGLADALPEEVQPEPQPEPPPEVQPEPQPAAEPQPDTDNKPRKTNKPA